MNQPTTCPQMDALVARHSEMRRAEGLGQKLAAKTIADFFERQKRMNVMLEAMQQHPGLRLSCLPAEPEPFDREAFVRAMNDPLPRIRIEGA